MDEPSRAEGTTESLVGRVFADRYLVQRPLARGAMGAVYLAEQRPLGRPVAVKVLDVRPTMSSTTGADRHDERFLREATLLSRLHHPNTVRVHDFGVHEGRSYLVMEYVDGPTLRELVQRGGRLDPVRAIRIARQVCGSLDEAHERGRVHRDLKPANVMIARDGDGEDLVKVVDFGLVKDIDDAVHMTGDGMMVGTPMFMAPEQIRGLKIDQRCDLYAIGVLLFYALTGGFPFDEGPPAAVLVAHLAEPPRRLRDLAPDLEVPDCLEWTIARCLEKAPADRFLNARELQRALRLCELALEDPTHVTLAAHLSLEGGQLVLPTEVRGAPTALRLGPEARVARRRAAWPIVLAALTVALTGGAWWWGRTTPDPRSPEPSVEVPSAPAPRPIEPPTTSPDLPAASAVEAPTPEPPAPRVTRAPRSPAPPREPARTAPEPGPALDARRSERASPAPIGSSDLKDPWGP